VTIPAADGFPLAARLYPSRLQRPLGVVVIAGAVGTTKERYVDYASYMAGLGWDVVAFDYRGLGASRGAARKAPALSMRDWGEKDLAGVIDWGRDRLTPRRVIVVGHSMGGQVPGLVPNHGAIDALVAVAAQRGYWRFWPGWKKQLIYFFFRVHVPLCLKLFGRLPMRLAGLEDLPEEAARDWARWGLARRYKDPRGDDLQDRFESFRSPILALSFSDDTYYAPLQAVDRLFAVHYVNAPVRRVHFAPPDWGVRAIGHSGFFDPRVCPERVWRSVADWMLASRSPRCASFGHQVGPPEQGG
jgi:predicted alpha/beta hydrolase